MQRSAPQSDQAATRPAVLPRIIAGPLLMALFVGLLAFPSRLLGLNDFLTTDEAYHWITRVERFSDAVAQGRWERTLLTGHPGVTNMWLGSIGLAAERMALNAGLIAPPTTVEHLAWLRTPGALLQTVIVALAYLLLRARIGAPAALVSALLWAGAPYLIAHSRLLHLDALLTAFVTLALILLIPARTPPLRGPAFLFSGVCAGLSLLTKGPALILLPFAGLLMFALLLEHARPAPALLFRQIGTAILQALGRYAIWLAIAAATVLLLWPALWAAPGATLERYWSEIAANGGRPNGDGQFFLGQPNADPGPLFYIVANLFRTTPLMLIGLLLALPLLFGRSTNPDIPRRTLLILVAFVLFWTLIMTLGPKKFDRYVLPTWPALLILAGCGLAAAGSWISTRIGAGQRARLSAGLVGALILLEGASVASYHPYYLSYYNPVLGGGPAAQRSLLIGWGEGMEQVGAWLRAQPDARGGPVLSALGRTLQPFVDVPVKDVAELGQSDANYAVVYLESIQRGALPEQYARIRDTVPLTTIRIHGIEYAWIHQLPRPYDTPINAEFGTAIQLRGVTITRAPQRLIVTPSWNVRAIPQNEYHVFIHLLDAQGTRVAQIDVAPGGGDAPATNTWQAGRQIAVPLPLALPAELPPGDYQLIMGMYTVADGTRLPVSGGIPADPQLAGPQAIRLADIRMPP